MLAWLTLAAAGAVAQDKCSNDGPTAVVSTKVGILRVRDAISSTGEGKQGLARLQIQFAARRSELENLRKRIVELQWKLDRRTSSEEDQAKVEKITQQFLRKRDKYNQDVQVAQARLVDAIGRKMLDVIDRYARANGYVVIDANGSTGPTAVDITREVVRLYDQQHPARRVPKWRWRRA